MNEIQNKEKWNELAREQPQSVFLQSWEWGEFQKSIGKTVYRFGDETNGALRSGAQIIINSLPLGWSYGYVPRGPLFKERPKTAHYADDFTTFTRDLLKQYSQNKFLFIRYEPSIELCYESTFMLVRNALDLHESSSIQPRDTRMCNLKITESELLQGMHQKWRYNIRVAERKGVVIEAGNYLEDFLSLTKETADRDGFTPHTEEYYRAMVESLPPEMLNIYVAKFEGKIIASNIVLRFGNTTTYLHGASSSNFRNVMAPHLLQWRQIQDARARGLRYYDFWGIAPSRRPSPKSSTWAGITRFKNGFGGVEKNYVGVYDLPIQKVWYSVYRRVRKLHAL